MQKSKYTFDYNQEIESLLDSTLAQISSEISACAMAKNIKYVVLGGGYGRGEGGALKVGNESKLYNDLDFFVISNTDNVHENKAIDDFFKELGARWTAVLGIDVDFGAARSVAYIVERANVLMWREMILGGNVVFGNSEDFKRHFDTNSKLPSGEFAKLMFNRCAGLFFARNRLASKTSLDAGDCDFISRNINKCILACGDVFLASRGVYKFPTLERLQFIESADIPVLLSDLRKRYKDAVEFKKYPTPYKSRAELEDSYEMTRRLAINTLDELRYFIKDTSTETLLRKLKNFRNKLRVCSQIKYFGYPCWPFENPIYSGISILIKLLYAEKISESDIKNFTVIWEKIN